MLNRILLLLFLLVPSVGVFADEPSSPGEIFDIVKVGAAYGQSIYEVVFRNTPSAVDVGIASRLAESIAKSRSYGPIGKVQVADGNSTRRKLFIVNTEKREDALPQFLQIESLSYCSPKTPHGHELIVIICEESVDSGATAKHREEVVYLLEQLYRRGAASKLQYQSPKQGSKSVFYKN